MLRRTLLSAALLSSLTLAASPAWAEQYPARPIRMVVPVPPGGGSDAIARVLAERLGKSMNTSVIVDNRPGAGGMIGSDFVAKSAADGYTILLINNAFVINPWLYKLPYDTMKDFAPVAMVATSPNVLVANPALPANNVQQLLDAAKSKPGEITVAVSTGQMSHLATVDLEQTAGIDVQLIPYKGAGAGNIDLLSGVVQLSFGTAPTYLQQIKAGKLKALGVGGSTPLESLPGVPTIGETVPGFEAETWFGLFAPAGTPAPVLEKLRAEVQSALKTPEMRERMDKDGYFAGKTQTQAELSAQLTTELAKWRDVIKNGNVRAE